MPSPSATSKFVLGTLILFKHPQFLKYNQNVFGILKSQILQHKLDHLSVPKTNFEIADGLDINLTFSSTGNTPIPYSLFGLSAQIG